VALQVVVPLVPEVFLPSSFLFDDLLLTGGETSESESPDMDSTLRFRDGLGEIVVRAMLGENAFAVDSVQLQKSVPVVYRDFVLSEAKVATRFSRTRCGSTVKRAPRQTLSRGPTGVETVGSMSEVVTSVLYPCELLSVLVPKSSLLRAIRSVLFGHNVKE
jgi:hypothetical protein